MIKSEINEHQTVVNETFDDEMIANIYLVGKIIDEAFKNNGKVIIFGNGGSAADAQHISAEFISKLKKNRKSLPAIALTVDTSALTAIGNDYGYEDLFSRQISSLCSKQDIVIGISTSGNSKNVIKALQESNEIGAKTIGFSGVDGIKGVDLDFDLRAKSKVTARIQEVHIMFGHLICGQAELDYV